MRTKGAKLAAGKGPGVSRGNISRHGESPRGIIQGVSDRMDSTNISTDSTNSSTDNSTDGRNNCSSSSSVSISASDDQTEDTLRINENLENKYPNDENTMEVKKEAEKDVEGEMSLCLRIAQSCLYEVYGVRSDSNVTVQVATVEGETLWG